MNPLVFGLRNLWREARAGELLVLAAALTIAAATVTAIGFLTDRISQAVALQASEVLAADIRLSSPQPLSERFFDLAEQHELNTASTLSFPSVVFKGDDSVLAGINAVSAGYPLRGELRVSASIDAQPQMIDSVPARGQVWLDTALIARLGAQVGDQVEIGASQFVIGKVLNFRPDQSPGFTSLAPSLLMNIDDIEATGLVQQGSRVRHSQLFAGARDDVQAFVSNAKTDLEKGVRIQDRGDVGEQLNNAIERSGRFLGLASLVSLLLASVAVAMSARRYAQRRMDTAALMKSVGSSQRFVVLSVITQILTIGIVASLLGAIIGISGERLLSYILADLLRDNLPSASLQPILLGAGTVIILLAGFALPSILRLSNTPPARVLRGDLIPPQTSTWFTYGIALLALSALVYWSVRDIQLVAVILGGTFITGGLLFLVGWVLVWLIGKRRGRVGVAWRYGLANIARRGTDSAVQIVAFGLALMVLLVLTLVRNDLLFGWRATLDENAPNHFFINIQPGERDGMARLLSDEGLRVPEFVPLVRARMTAVNGQEVGTREYASPRGKRLASRDANLTYAEAMSPSNKLLAGQWWPADYQGEARVSVEVDAARDMNLELGDVLTIDIAGEELVATVTSLREVKWDSFQPNFFMVFSPNSLLDFPQTFVTSLQIDNSQRGVLSSLVRTYPSVSVIDIKAILDQVRRIIDKAALAVQSVFLFTLAAGLVVLFAAVQSTLDERRFESALLRTFGAKRSTVFAGLATEFAVLGLAAGLFASIGASIIGGLAARQIFDLPYELDPTLWLSGTLAGVLIVGVSGVVAARSALNTPPNHTLRHA